MNNLSNIDALDQAIDELVCAGSISEHTVTPGSNLRDLLVTADELRCFPHPDFKSRLKVELEWEAAGRSMTSDRSVHTGSRDIMPSLSGQSTALYPLRGTNVAASVAIHACLALLVGMGFLTVHRAPQILGITRDSFPIHLSAYPTPQGSGSGTKGGGGAHDKSNASKGVLPMRSRMQLAPPLVQLPDQEVKLPVRASIIAPPDLNLQRTGPMGDPLSNLMMPSGGPGIRGGIGSGDGSGIGSERGSGSGTGAFGPGNGVSWPQAIYHPEPEFSDEARREHYQGVVSLLIVVGTDGRAHNLQILRALGMGLDEKALEAVRTWRFEPGKKDGRPVPVLMEVDVDFRIH